MSAGLNVLITLKDMFSAKMGVIGNSTNQQEKRLKKLRKEMSQLKESMKSGTTGFMKAGLGLMGVSTALDSLSSIASEAMGNYALQAKAEGQVVTSLRKSMEGMDTSAIDAMSDSYKNLASELQGVGVIGDEVTLTGMATMTNLGMKPEDVKSLTPLVQDLAVKMNGVNVNAENFAETSKMVGNAINKGSLKAFQAQGISVTEDEQKMFKAMSTAERTAYLQNKLAKAVGGTNKAMANTPAGKQAQAMNSYGDALEAVGKPLYQLKGVIQGALIAPMNWLAEKIPIAVEWFTELASTIGGYFAPILESLGISESAKEWEFWGDIIGTVFNEVGYIIGVVAKAIGLAIAGIVFVIVQLGKIIYNICSGIVSAWQGMVDMVTPILDYWVDHITNVFTNIWKIIDGAITILAGILALDWRTAWQGAGEVFDGVMGLMRNAWDNTFGLIINGLSILGDKLASFKNKLMGGMSDYNTAVENAKQGDYAHGTLGFATGTSYFKGGFTHINENHRGELVKLPNGSQIIPHDLSKQLLGGNNVSININENNRTELVKLPNWSQIIPHDLIKQLQGGDNRGELVKLPNWSQIIPHDLSKQLSGGMSDYNTAVENAKQGNYAHGSQIVPHDLSKQLSGGNNVSININVQGNVIGNEDFYNECGNAIYNHLRDALGNV